jgi:hypothetical protein
MDPGENPKGHFMDCIFWWICRGPFPLFGLVGGEALRVEPGTERAVRIIWPYERDLPPNYGPFCSADELQYVTPLEMRVYLGPNAPEELTRIPGLLRPQLFLVA